MENLKVSQEVSRENEKHFQHKNKARYNKKNNPKIPDLQIGDKVLLKIHKVPKGVSRKLYHKSGGPFIISEKGPNYTYKLIRVSNMRPLKTLINAANIRPYYDPGVHRADLSYNNRPNQPATPLDSQANDQSQQIALPPALNPPMLQTQRRKPVSDQTYVFKRIIKGRFRNDQREFRIEWETGESTWEPDSVFSDDMLRDINKEYTLKGTKRKYTS